MSKVSEIETLFIIGANPAYDAPGDLAVADIIVGCRSRRSSAHIAMRRRNAARGTCPQRIALEAWSDIRAFDGTASIVQPLIRPLYDTRSAHEVLEFISSGTGRSSFDTRARLLAESVQSSCRL